MNAHVLHRALGLKGYDVIECWEDQGEICVVAEVPRESLRCPDCRSRQVHIHERHTRQWRSVPIGLKPTRIFMDVPRVKCLECGAKRRVEVDFAAPLVRHTKDFERFAAGLLQYLTPQDLTTYLGISWGTAAAIDQRRMKALTQPKLKTLQRLAIDEIYSGKLLKYLTLVLDLDSGAVVNVSSGRGVAALRSFFKRLKQSGAKIKAVATDMAGGYIKAVQTYLPNATLVFDRFHIVKLMNEKLTTLRRDLYREATDMLKKQVLKGVRWLLLMGAESLDSPARMKSAKLGQPSDKERLKEAMKLNESLLTAYILKEDLRALWAQGTKARGKAYLEKWCRRAAASGIAVLQTMSKTLLTHARAIIAWYDEPISTGPLEGTNNKIKLLQRRAYGYRNREHFILRILTLHHTQQRLVG